MVNSVIQNKGFYVARYEASKNNDSSKAQSKRNQNVWGNISHPDAIIKSQNYNTMLHSHLIYGIEWDSILKWLEGNAVISSSTSGLNKTMDIDDLQTSSDSWGNYNYNSTATAGNAAINSGKLQTTGKSEYWKANNIYDLVGNAYEWTQERWSTDVFGITYFAVRGCDFGFIGGKQPVAIRNAYSYSDANYSVIGFRFSFYL